MRRRKRGLANQSQIDKGNRDRQNYITDSTRTWRLTRSNSLSRCSRTYFLQVPRKLELLLCDFQLISTATTHGILQGFICCCCVASSHQSTGSSIAGILLSHVRLLVVLVQFFNYQREDHNPIFSTGPDPETATTRERVIQ